MSLEFPGFAHPAADAQSCFRAALDAIAQPGRVVRVGAALTPPPPLDLAAASLLLTLVDADTPLHVEDDHPGLREWLAFHCGAPFAPQLEARFVWSRLLPDLAALAAGTDDGPEESATVILQVRALGIGKHYRLDGPGLDAPADFAVDGLPQDFVAQWTANHRRFPRGVDLFLTAGAALAAFPRSVAIMEA